MLALKLVNNACFPSVFIGLHNCLGTNSSDMHVTNRFIEFEVEAKEIKPLPDSSNSEGPDGIYEEG